MHCRDWRGKTYRWNVEGRGGKWKDWNGSGRLKRRMGRGEEREVGVNGRRKLKQIGMSCIQCMYEKVCTA
jgi:hypothetical protein